MRKSDKNSISSLDINIFALYLTYYVCMYNEIEME